MRADVKKVVDEVVAFLNEGGDASKDLWRILTALRGPANDSHALKEETTARLRYAIGLRPQFSINRSGYSFCGALVSSKPLQSVAEANEIEAREIQAKNAHFGVHFSMAVGAFHRDDAKPEGE